MFVRIHQGETSLTVGSTPWATGVMRRSAPLAALRDPRAHRRRTCSTGETGEGSKLGRIEVTVIGQAPFRVPDAFTGGTQPDRAADAVRAFLAQRAR